MTTRIARVPRVAFRADASHELGYGHVARLCALIEEVETRGIRPLVLFGGDGVHVAQWLRERGVSVALDNWTPIAVAHLAEERRLDAVIIDGPAIANSLVAELTRRKVRSILIDDRGTPLAVDAVVNHNIHAPELASKYPGARHCLLGRRYMMLRKEFRRFTRGSCRPMSGARLRVVVTFGGSDPHNDTARIMRLVPDDRSLELVVILGPGYHDDGSLAIAVAEVVGAGHTVDIRRSPDDAAGLFVSADAAICAAGGTLGELAYLGCPAIAYAIVADQVVPARQQVRDGLISGGRKLGETEDAVIAADLAAFLLDDDGRNLQRGRALATADSDGTKRIVDELLMA